MRRLSVCCLGFCLGLSLSAVGCSSTEQGSDSSESGDPGTPTGTSDSSGGSSSRQGSNPDIQAGTLTAGVWDDNRNLDYFTTYLEKTKSLPGFVDIPASEREASRQLFAQRAPKSVLDIAFVIDTTGSMGDEIQYVSKEIQAIADSIKAQFPSADQRWAVSLYRDVGDDYVTRNFDFTSDVSTFQKNIAAQNAGGGGDLPESPEKGLASALQFSWRRDAATARLLFWIADAPHHTENATRMLDVARGARSADVHLYPVSASGTDELLEVTMRSMAQFTGGRYLFLTDDSGVGGVHKEPTIPCYFVTKLDRAMVRMASIELSGVYREPEAAEIIRAGGDPKAGVCTLADGNKLDVF